MKVSSANPSKMNARDIVSEIAKLHAYALNPTDNGDVSACEDRLGDLKRECEARATYRNSNSYIRMMKDGAIACKIALQEIDAANIAHNAKIVSPAVSSIVEHYKVTAHTTHDYKPLPTIEPAPVAGLAYVKWRGVYYALYVNAGQVTILYQDSNSNFVQGFVHGFKRAQDSRIVHAPVIVELSTFDDTDVCTQFARWFVRELNDARHAILTDAARMKFGEVCRYRTHANGKETVLLIKRDSPANAEYPWMTIRGYVNENDVVCFQYGNYDLTEHNALSNYSDR